MTTNTVSFFSSPYFSLPAMINLFKRNTSTTDTCHHHHYIHHPVLGLGLAAKDVDRPPNVLQSAMLKPNAPPPPPPPPPLPPPPPCEKRVIDGLTSCTESLGSESSDEIHNDNGCNVKENENNNNNNDNCYDDVDDDDEIWRRRMMKAEVRGKVRSFPPPLSSLNRNGKPSFYLRPVRKDGRLELTEVRIHRSEILHASRHNGRLTLHLVPDLEEEEFEEEEEEEEVVEEEEEEERVGEWKLRGVGVGVGGSEGLRRCHEMVVNQHHHHHHDHHGNMRMCGISIV